MAAKLLAFLKVSQLFVFYFEAALIFLAATLLHDILRLAMKRGLHEQQPTAEKQIDHNGFLTDSTISSSDVSGVFLPAGSFNFWEAWVYLTIIFVSMLAFCVYFLKNDPKLLERRMRSKEKETEQKWIIGIMSVCFIFAFLLPGFDQRFGWSRVPVIMVIIADIVVVLGYGFVFLVLKENSYASRVIEVEKDQKVISSGPYAVVRHPMYLGVALMFLFTPLALGSYWALIPAVLMIFVLVPRIFNEEKVLERDLEGYREYMQQVEYRLIPGIW